MVNRLDLRTHSVIFLVMVGLAIALSAMLYMSGKAENIPATLFAAFTAIFAYSALAYTFDKFRLDLFDRRFEIYTNLLTYASLVQERGEVRVAALEEGQRERLHNASAGSFRGQGLHKSRTLFGSDIIERLEKLNKSHAYLSVYTGPDVAGYNAEEHTRHLLQVTNLIAELPALFERYIYFGDYCLNKTTSSSPS